MTLYGPNKSETNRADEQFDRNGASEEDKWGDEWSEKQVHLEEVEVKNWNGGRKFIPQLLMEGFVFDINKLATCFPAYFPFRHQRISPIIGHKAFHGRRHPWREYQLPYNIFGKYEFSTHVAFPLNEKDIFFKLPH